MNILFATAITLHCIISNPDTLEIKKNIPLQDTTLINMQIINEVLQLNRVFDGYLVFEVPDFQSVSDTNNFYCTIFYVDLLNDFKMNEAIIVNTSTELSLMAGFRGTNDSIESNFRLLYRCFRNFSSRITKDCGPFSFRDGDIFNTDLFEKATLVERNRKRYFIFNFELYGILYEYYPGSWGKSSRKKYGNLIRTFIPTSELIEFSPVDLKTLEDFGFKKSNVFVRFY